jgi:hypothetical protein
MKLVWEVIFAMRDDLYRVVVDLRTVCQALAYCQLVYVEW